MELGLKLLGQSVLLVLTIAIIAIGPVMHWNSHPGSAIVAMFIAGGICLATAMIGLFPLAFLELPRQASWLPGAWMAGMAARLLLTVMAGAIAWTVFVPEDQTTAFALWTMVFYLALLSWETITTVKLINKTPASIVF